MKKKPHGKTDEIRFIYRLEKRFLIFFFVSFHFKAEASFMFTNNAQLVALSLSTFTAMIFDKLNSHIDMVKPSHRNTYR